MSGLSVKVLIACEYSGVVREAFKSKGHDVWSCDLLDTEQPGQHIKDDILKILEDGWDLMIAHPPCTLLARSGARWWKGQEDSQREALNFVARLMDAPIPRIAVENPIGHISSAIRKPDQIIQPWQFGHGETKATCLWLKGLPKLQSTCVVEGREPKVHWLPPGPNRWKERSRTYVGIAHAMADQWS